MKQEDKDLLLKDLCTRLPYKVICECSPINFRGTLGEISRIYKMCRLFDDFSDENVYIYDCRPYLFPMSSMTEEQKREYNSLRSIGTDECGDITYFNTFKSVDWLNENHFDYRGLIPMGLAIDCTNLNIY